MPKASIPRTDRLLVSRANAARLLGGVHVATLIRVEHEGRLTAIKLSHKVTGKISTITNKFSTLPRLGATMRAEKTRNAMFREDKSAECLWSCRPRGLELARACSHLAAKGVIAHVCGAVLLILRDCPRGLAYPCASRRLSEGSTKLTMIKAAGHLMVEN